MSFDQKAYWLAERFIEDTVLDRKTHTPRLAQRIQDTIDEYLDEQGAELGEGE